MIDHLKEFPGMFDPSEVKLLAAALDKAWATVQASGAYIDGTAEQVRSILATHIIKQAQAGERDLQRLCDGALVHLAKAGNI